MTENSTDLPAIVMTTEDKLRLSRLAESAGGSHIETADFLAREIERATVMANGASGFVAMGSTVEFRDNTSGQVRSATIVFPEEADLASGRVSVMTPIGAALIGLSPGQTIDYEARDGSPRSLTVLRVEKAMAA